jgi:hypothetical protein
LEAYATLASKFIVVREEYSIKIKRAAEKLYRSLEKYNAWDLIDNVDDCACAIYMLTGIHDLGKDLAWVASAFEANLAKTQVLTSYALSNDYGIEQTEDKKDEID